jgi:hypothetical protein
MQRKSSGIGKSILSLVIFMISALSFAQTLPSPEDPLWRYQAWMETAGLAKPKNLMFQDSGPRAAEDNGPWKLEDAKPAREATPAWRMMPSEVGVYYNSNTPSGMNAGGIWKGVGFTSWACTGVEASWGPFSGTFELQDWASQNASFVLGPSANSQQPLMGLDGGNIDTPQRFGYVPFNVLDIANSQIRFTWNPLYISFGNENLWVGPAMFNPLLLSSNAAGFPHGLLGLQNCATPIGNVEAQLLYGQLADSQYWPNPTERFFGGLFLAYQPVFFPQLTLGAERTVFSYWDALSPAVFAIPLWPGTGPSSGAGTSHQHISLTWRLLFPEVGFEFYGEYGKNDFSYPPYLYFLNPEHESAYMLGLKKTFPLPDSKLLGVGFEMVDLTQSIESLINLNGDNVGGDFYSHWAILEGYTNNGMILGAGAGNGSEMEVLYADLYFPKGHFGLELSRLLPLASHLYWDVNIRPGNELSTDAIFQLKLLSDYCIRDWFLTFFVAESYEVNRYFSQDNNSWNFSLQFSIKYLFR